MIKFDMWRDNKPEEANRADCFFYPSDCSYRGNLYIDQKIIGDYTASNSVELGAFFKRIGINWNWN